VSDVIDLEQRRRAKLPTSSFVDMGDLPAEEAAQWLVQLFQDGERVPDRCGLNFGYDGCEPVALSGEQCRLLGRCLIQVARQLERAAKQPFVRASKDRESGHD
jgi:hypothetical protein